VREYFSSAEELDEKREKKKMQVSLELKDMIERMKHTFKTKVSLIGNDRKGRIYIDYYNTDDLDRISEIIDLVDRQEKDKKTPPLFCGGDFFIYNICRARTRGKKRTDQSFFSSSGGAGESASSGGCGLGSRISCKLLNSIISTKNSRASTASMITYTGLNQTTDGMMNARSSAQSTALTMRSVLNIGKPLFSLIRVLYHKQRFFRTFLRFFRFFFKFFECR